MIFRMLNAVMAALFALSVAVQYNDPDPLRWMAIYGAACAISIVSAVRGVAPFATSMAVAIVALVWSVFWMVTSKPTLSVFTHMFDAWEMKSTPIEEAREACGLLIVAVWMAINVLRAWVSAGRAALG